jgi:hypothetical protein
VSTHVPGGQHPEWDAGVVRVGLWLCRYPFGCGQARPDGQASKVQGVGLPIFKVDYEACFPANPGVA